MYGARVARAATKQGSAGGAGPAGTPARAAPSGLSREAIVDAAAELFRSDGFEALTMRRLAERCGVGAMTLYGYFATKEELLGALADRALAEVELPSAEASDWRGTIADVFRSVRRTFLDHPELAQIVATQRVSGLSAYRGAETVFAALERAGLDERGQLAGFEALTAYTAGFVLRETASGAGAPALGERLDRIASLPADEFSHVVRVAEALAARDAEQHFEFGLGVMLSGIAELGAEGGEGGDPGSA